MTDPRYELIQAAQAFHRRGWMLGTAGNLSARLADGSFWITASGRSKGELRPSDFIRFDADGNWEALLPGLKPSAETSIHQAVYDLFPTAQACFHVHSVEANLVSTFTIAPDLPLPPLEMLKGLGVWEEAPTACTMPLFENPLEVPKIAQAMRDRFTVQPPPIPALLIRHHGVTVWGSSPETARNAIELVEYIFRYMVQARHLGVSLSPSI
jgi:methylthioribulose-1-phosphate dehydratase